MVLTSQYCGFVGLVGAPELNGRFADVIGYTLASSSARVRVLFEGIDGPRALKPKNLSFIKEAEPSSSEVTPRSISSAFSSNCLTQRSELDCEPQQSTEEADASPARESFSTEQDASTLSEQEEDQAASSTMQPKLPPMNLTDLPTLQQRFPLGCTVRAAGRKNVFVFSVL